MIEYELLVFDIIVIVISWIINKVKIERQQNDKSKIVTDFSVSHWTEVVKEFDITVVPLSVMIDSALLFRCRSEEGEFLRFLDAS